MFNAIDTSGTGLTVFRTWIDVLAHNIANVNTVKSMDDDAFQAQFVRAKEIAAGRDGIGQGVQATELPKGDPAGRPTYDPSSPLANDEGYVRMPDMNLSDQMGNLIIAQRAFQANANVIDRSKSMYEAAIQIGKGM